LKVSFDDYKIDLRKNAIFVVNAKFNALDKLPKTIQLGFEESTHLNAIEEKTESRVKVATDLVAGTFAKIAGKTYTFRGGEIKLTNVKLSKTIDAAQGATEVVI
jgi:hypothetical protein